MFPLVWSLFISQVVIVSRLSIMISKSRSFFSVEAFPPAWESFEAGGWESSLHTKLKKLPFSKTECLPMSIMSDIDFQFISFELSCCSLLWVISRFGTVWGIIEGLLVDCQPVEKSSIAFQFHLIGLEMNYSWEFFFILPWQSILKLESVPWMTYGINIGIETSYKLACTCWNHCNTWG